MTILVGGLAAILLLSGYLKLFNLAVTADSLGQLLPLPVRLRRPSALVLAATELVLSAWLLSTKATVLSLAITSGFLLAVVLVIGLSLLRHDVVPAHVSVTPLHSP